jgi:hypothetical protein
MAKIVQVIPNTNTDSKLKSLLKEKERELRGKGTTFLREAEGRWVHTKYPGWITWDEAAGGVLVAEIRTKSDSGDGRLLQAFIGYLNRHLGKYIQSISIHYR